MKAGGSVVRFRKEDTMTETESERDLKMLRCWLWRWRKGPQTNKCTWLLDAGEGKQMDSFLEPLKGCSPVAPCRSPSKIHFGLVTSRTVR